LVSGPLSVVRWIKGLKAQGIRRKALGRKEWNIGYWIDGERKAAYGLYEPDAGGSARFVAES